MRYDQSMILLDHAPYTPFDTARTRHPPGLSPLDPAEWVVVHTDYAAQMAYRTDLLAREAATVLAALPGSEAAALDLYGAVLDHLAARADFQVGDQIMRPDGAQVAPDPNRPLQTLCLLTAEDWCLMLPPEEDGEYTLGAAILCFPSRWLLSEKIGRPMTDIHEPVEEYDDALARRVNRMFQAIKPGRPMVRHNWLIHGDPELYRPIGRHDKTRRVREEPWTTIYLRTERQTLRRLPKTGAVAFGIKTSICPISALDAVQSAALDEALAEKDQDAYLSRAANPVIARARDQLQAQAE